MENAQALAATAKFRSEPERAQVLLLKVYTPSRVAPETRQPAVGKTIQHRDSGPRQSFAATPAAIFA
jgi:hypothetical protein